MYNLQELEKMESLRSRLKKCQPYFIDKDLLPQMYFKQDENDREYWLFKYSFILGLSDTAIGVRLGNYDRYQIYRWTIKILNRNKSIVEEFLNAQINNI